MQLFKFWINLNLPDNTRPASPEISYLDHYLKKNSEKGPGKTKEGNAKRFDEPMGATWMMDHSLMPSYRNRKSFSGASRKFPSVTCLVHVNISKWFFSVHEKGSWFSCLFLICYKIRFYCISWEDKNVKRSKKIWLSIITQYLFFSINNVGCPNHIFYIALLFWIRVSTSLPSQNVIFPSKLKKYLLFFFLFCLDIFLLNQLYIYKYE